MLLQNQSDATLASIIEAHINSHLVAGHEWPDDAQYAVTYELRTWPCGWDTHTNVKFFPNAYELRAWYDSMNNWARLEDNDYRYVIYMWDLGPQLVVDEAPHLMLM